MPIVGLPVFAEETSQAVITNAGNKRCPISGGPVTGEDFVVYEGVRYGVCCSGCDETFLADPKKYLAKMKRFQDAVREYRLVLVDNPK